MERKETILNELREISPVVANITNEVPYTVPDGYFEHIASQVLNRIKAAEGNDVKEELQTLSPLLGGIEKKTPFEIPQNYFNDLAGNIVSGVQAIEFVNEELENLSPLMNNLKSKNVYEVPQGYFESQPAAILSKIKHQPAKVIVGGFRKRIIRFAAAAVAAGVILIGGYTLFYHSSTATDPTTENIAKASDQELESFMNDNTMTLADINTTTASTEINEEDTKDLFADVSDEELQQYLEQHGTTTLNSITN